MPFIAPYRALHYNPKMIPDLSKVVIPPYDVIGKDEAKKYLNRSPYNLAHIVLPRSADEDYSTAANLLKKWREVDVLHLVPTPCYYLYQQTFKTDNGVSHTRNTLLAAVELTEYSAGNIRPHENTHGKPKADRLKILQKTQTNLSHVFGIVKDKGGVLQSFYENWIYHTPLFKTTTDDGVEHVVWTIEGTKATEIESFFAAEPIYIVDGHHRYEAALANARETNCLGDRKKPGAFMMFAVCNAYDPALVVFPTHRLVANVDLTKIERADVEKEFELQPTTHEHLKKFVAHPHNDPRFGLYLWGEAFMATPRHWKRAAHAKATNNLSVTWSDDHLLKPFCAIEETERSAKITYEKNFEVLWEKKSPSDLIVFHAPPAIEQILNVADNKEFMPQKSTYFYPKLGAGFTLRSLVG